MKIYDEIVDRLKDVDVISFDVFDTLVFRNVREPHQVFDKTFHLAKECFPDYMCARDWRTIRTSLPKKAKSKKDPALVTLDDYLHEVPDFITDVEKLHKAEIEAEKNSVLINPDMYYVLCKCKKEHGKKIILVSDMYLSSDEFYEILSSAGIDMSLINRLFVSNEYGARKDNGHLYKVVTETMNVSPNRIIHIGDNWKSDFINAKKMGWQSIYYPIISEAKYKHPYLPYENLAFCKNDLTGGSIYALRCLAASHASGNNIENKWFEMGAMTYGPLLTFAAEWVLDQAEKKTIHNIYPLMREGIFLSQLLHNAAAARQWEGNIEPLYISRRALYPALLSVIEERDIFFSFIANTGISRNLTVGDVLMMYNVDTDDELYQYQDIIMKEARNVLHRGKPLSDIMNTRFFSNIEETRKQNEDADELVWEYFKTLSMDREDFITFDYGYVGTTQNAIERILNRRNSKGHGLHLLIVGKETIQARGNLNNNTDIHGFASFLGEHKDIIDSMNSQISDSLLKCRCGSVTGYTRINSRIKPVMGEPDYNQEIMNNVDAFQAGVLEFQRVYHLVNKSGAGHISCDISELLTIAARLTVFPTYSEACALGALSSDNEQMIRSDELTLYKELGFDNYFRDKFRDNRAKQWYRGMDSILDGLRYYKESILKAKFDNEYLYALYASRIVNNTNHPILIGTIMEFMLIAWPLNLLDAWGKVECLICEDNSFVGELFLGKSILGLDAIQGGELVYLNRDRIKINNMKDALTQRFKETKVFDFYQ